MKAEDYFSPWDGWYCNVESKNCVCGEVIGCDLGALIQHLRTKHNIEVEQ